jgi:hypothetical protein
LSTSRSPGSSEAELRRELEDQRQKLRRYQVYLGAALAVFGVGTLAAIALVGLYGLRLASGMGELQTRLSALDERHAVWTEDLGAAVARQKQELDAIRRSANDDLEAMREAQRKLAAIRDPQKELSALREANVALWNELASQRAELLDALREGEGHENSEIPGSRFRLGETTYFDPNEDPSVIKGFLSGAENIKSATNLPPNPALVVIEVSPEQVGPGDPYQLSVRLVNRSNRSLAPASLRLDWSFQGKNTGGNVPVDRARVDAQKSVVLYAVAGEWTEAHRSGPVRVTATVTLDGGAQLSNSLYW